MPLIEYFLLALMGSGAAAGAGPGTPPSAVIGADAIVQPNGGAMLIGQDTPPKKSRRIQALRRRRHKHYRRHPLKTGYTPKKGGRKIRS
jgi:hypothetical protein